MTFLSDGAKATDRFSRDPKATLPDVRGFSSRNLKYLVHFAEHCPVGRFGQQPAAQLPWFHIVTLLTKLEDAEARGWYGAVLSDVIRLDNDALTCRSGPEIHLMLRPDGMPATQTLPAKSDSYLFKAFPDPGCDQMSAYTEPTALDGLAATGWPVIPVPTRTGEP